MAATLTAALSPSCPDALEQLIAEARTGDRAALDRFLLLIQSRVFTFAFRMAGDHATAEDVTQEALFRICCSLDRYTPNTNLWGWIYRITVRLAHDHRDRHPSEPVEDAGLESPADDPERREQVRHVLAALSVLTAKERAALVLIDMEGMSCREAAAVMSCLSITARTRAAQARKKVRKELSGRYPELREGGR